MATEEAAEAKKTMTPWEQHSAVISIPRFDYNAPSSLLQHSHSGFLITCTIKREKSATKEAISMLEKATLLALDDSSTGIKDILVSLADLRRALDNQETIEPNPSEISDASGSTKKRKLSVEESDGANLNGGGSESLDDEFRDRNDKPPEDASLPSKAGQDMDRSSLLSLVKLTRSGLVLFTIPRSHPVNTLDVVSDIIQSLRSGTLRSPLWCHRIFPIQATCNLDEQALRDVVQKLVLQYVKGKGESPARPVKFAVGYSRRGIEETEFKSSKDSSSSDVSKQFPLLDRNKCFGVVAGAVKEVITDSVVDLKTPEVCVLVELLPLSVSGISNRSLVVGVSVLPEELITAKPRLSVKALVPDSKPNNGNKK